MSWIIVKYHPGFSADLTSWETRISQDGVLSQTVRISRFSPRVERTDHLSAQLSPPQLAELRRLIAATDFGAIAAASHSYVIDDAESCSVTVRQGEQVLHFDGPLMFLPTLQQHEWGPPIDLSPALALWHALDAASPYGLHSTVA